MFKKSIFIKLVRNFFFIVFSFVVLANNTLILDPNTKHNTKIDISQNGVPILNISTPSNDGISVNDFLEYNVDKIGQVINNADNVGRSHLAGLINGNPNLSGNEAAKLVVIQVNGVNKSEIKGYIEALSREKVDVILSNQNGIFFNGGGLINISTFIPKAEKGTITIGDKGFDGRGTDKILSVSEAMELYGELLGNKEIEVNLENKGEQDRLVLDGNLFGSMYGNQIKIVITGSNNRAKIDGSIVGKESVNIKTDSNIQVNEINGNNVEIKGNNLVNNKEISSENTISLQTNEIINNGRIVSKDIVNVKSNSLVNNGDIQGNDGILEIGNIENNKGIEFLNDINIQGIVLVNEKNAIINSGNDLNINVHSLENKSEILGNNIKIFSNTIENKGEVTELDNYEIYYETFDKKRLSEEEVKNNWIDSYTSSDKVTKRRHRRWESFKKNFLNTIINKKKDSYFVNNKKEVLELSKRGQSEVGLKTSSSEYKDVALKGKIESNAKTEYAKIMAKNNITINAYNILNKDGLISSENELNIQGNNLENSVTVGDKIYLKEGIESIFLRKRGKRRWRLRGEYKRYLEVSDTVYVSGKPSILESNILNINVGNIITSSIKEANGIENRGNNIHFNKRDILLHEINNNRESNLSLGYELETRKEYVEIDKYYSNDYFLNRIGGRERTNIRTNVLENTGTKIGDRGITFIKAKDILNTASIHGNQITIISEKDIKNKGIIKGIDNINLISRYTILNETLKKTMKNGNERGIEARIETTGDVNIYSNSFLLRGGYLKSNNLLIDTEKEIVIDSLSIETEDNYGFKRYRDKFNVGSNILSENIFLKTDFLNIRGSNINANKGLNIDAKNINISNTKNIFEREEKQKDKGIFSKTVKNIYDYVETSNSSNIFSEKINIQSQNDINIKSSNIIGKEINIDSKSNINIFEDKLVEIHNIKQKSSGISLKLNESSIYLGYNKSKINNNINKENISVSNILSENELNIKSNNLTSRATNFLGNSVNIKAVNDINLIDAKQIIENSLNVKNKGISVGISVGSDILNLLNSSKEMSKGLSLNTFEHVRNITNSVGNISDVIGGKKDPKSLFNVGVNLSLNKTIFSDLTREEKSIGGKIKGENVSLISGNNILIKNQKINVENDLYVGTKKLTLEKGEDIHNYIKKTSSKGVTLGYDLISKTANVGLNISEDSEKEISKIYVDNEINVGNNKIFDVEEINIDNREDIKIESKSGFSSGIGVSFNKDKVNAPVLSGSVSKDNKSVGFSGFTLNKIPNLEVNGVKLHTDLFNKEDREKFLNDVNKTINLPKNILSGIDFHTKVAGTDLLKSISGAVRDSNIDIELKTKEKRQEYENRIEKTRVNGELTDESLGVVEEVILNVLSQKGVKDAQIIFTTSEKMKGSVAKTDGKTYIVDLNDIDVSNYDRVVELMQYEGQRFNYKDKEVDDIAVRQGIELPVDLGKTKISKDSKVLQYGNEVVSGLELEGFRDNKGNFPIYNYPYVMENIKRKKDLSEKLKLISSYSLEEKRNLFGEYSFVYGPNKIVKSPYEGIYLLNSREPKYLKGILDEKSNLHLDEFDPVAWKRVENRFEYINAEKDIKQQAKNEIIKFLKENKDFFGEKDFSKDKKSIKSSFKLAGSEEIVEGFRKKENKEIPDFVNSLEFALGNTKLLGYVIINKELNIDKSITLNTKLRYQISDKFIDVYGIKIEYGEEYDMLGKLNIYNFNDNEIKTYFKNEKEFLNYLEEWGK